MAAGGHFGWPKITFDRISRHFRSIRNFFYFLFCSQNVCRRPFWMTENHVRLHFSPFQINTQLVIFFWFFFTKWLPAAILHDRKSLSIASFRSHFRSICNFNFFHKMAAGDHFVWPKITFDRISRHFRSIYNFDFFLTKWLPLTILMTENHFRSHFSPFQINTQFWLFFLFSQNGCRRPFWMTENHFRMHFSPFQINTQFHFYLFFFAKWPPAAILEVRFVPFWITENHFRSHFSPFQISTQLFLFGFLFQNGRRRSFWKSDLRQEQ